MIVSFAQCSAWLTVLALVCSYKSGAAQSLIRSNSAPDLIPEGIAVDSLSGQIYVTSIFRKKIIVSDSSGVTRDFIESGADGFLKGLGIKVDYKRRWLWAVSNDREGAAYVARIHAFDLNTSKRIVYDEIKEASPHLFNDLAIDTDGMLYITDSEANSVYSYAPANRQLALFLKSPDLTYANGIAVRNGLLYIASNKGLTVADIKTRKQHLITTATVKYSDGFDGLVIRGDQLFGVYNLPDSDRDMAIICYTLSKDGRNVVGVRAVDAGNSNFHAPTTAAISKGYLFVLANSHLLEYNANRETAEGIASKLSPVTILKYKL